MDQLQTRLDALEQQMHTVNRRLRWWRGLACSVIVLALLTWALPAGTGEQQSLAQRVAALEDLLKPFSREKNEVFITGANLHIRNGLGSTDCFDEEGGIEIPDCPNGLGNLIVGYNELRNHPDFPDVRTGSHNVVVGNQLNFSSFGGLVVGQFNEISGEFASVSGGGNNTASGFRASVSGGGGNTASGFEASVSGGLSNMASGSVASISGGNGNIASGLQASVSGGQFNRASGSLSSVSGGGGAEDNGGASNTASGNFSSVSGGAGNTASGDWSAVSGGQNITQAAEFGWAAGSEADEVVVGNFRSP